MTQYTDDDIRNSVTDEYGNTIGSVEKVTAGSIGAGGARGISGSCSYRICCI